MIKYTLYLDESGDFKEHSSKKPSCVSGYLVRDSQRFSSNDADAIGYSLLRKKKYSKIDWRNFHAIEEIKKGNPVTDFIVDIIALLMEKGSIELIKFENRKGLVIVDSDKTYLNVFSDGVLSTIKRILSSTNDDVKLEVFYAHRQNDKVRESSSGQDKIRIPQEEYDFRIRERIDRFVATLPEYQKERLKPLSYRTDNATKEPLLKIADAISFAVRGGAKAFSQEQKAAIESYGIVKFIVPELSTWAAIDEMLIQGRIAEAIFLWHCGICDDIDKIYVARFYERIFEILSKENAKSRQIIYATISQFLGKLTNERRFDTLNNFYSNMENNFFPLAKEKGINTDELYFDIHFYRLTVATHEGDNKQGVLERSICQENLSHLPADYASLDYYLLYKIREVELEKNMFAFNAAENNLKRLEEILSNLVTVTKMIDELGDLKDRIKSSTLAKVYGSMVQVCNLLAVTDKSYIVKAECYSEKSIQEFTRQSDISRQYQYLSVTKCIDKKYKDSYDYLVKSVVLNENTEIEPLELLKKATVSFDDNTLLFWLMYYANLMAQAVKDHSEIGKSMYDAWISQKATNLIKDDVYPASIILWRIGTCKFALRQKNGDSFFERAIMASNEVGNSTIYASSLAMEAEYIAWKSKKQCNTNSLKTRLKCFIESDPPEPMLEYFSSWPEILVSENLSSETLFSIASKIPIL